jgi:hypothetical protein
VLYRRRWSSPHFTVALLAAGRRRVVRTCLPYPPDHLYSGSPRTFRLFLLASPPAHCLTLEGCPRHGSVAALGMDPSQPSAWIRRRPRHGSVAALGMDPSQPSAWIRRSPRQGSVAALGMDPSQPSACSVGQWLHSWSSASPPLTSPRSVGLLLLMDEQEPARLVHAQVAAR